MPGNSAEISYSFSFSTRSIAGATVQASPPSFGISKPEHRARRRQAPVEWMELVEQPVDLATQAVEGCPFGSLRAGVESFGLHGQFGGFSHGLILLGDVFCSSIALQPAFGRHRQPSDVGLAASPLSSLADRPSLRVVRQVLRSNTPGMLPSLTWINRRPLTYSPATRREAMWQHDSLIPGIARCTSRLRRRQYWRSRGATGAAFRIAKGDLVIERVTRAPLPSASYA